MSAAKCRVILSGHCSEKQNKTKQNKKQKTKQTNKKQNKTKTKTKQKKNPTLGKRQVMLSKLGVEGVPVVATSGYLFLLRIQNYWFKFLETSCVCYNNHSFNN